MTTSRGSAEARATARMKALLPELIAADRDIARVHARRARALADANEVAEDWRAEEGATASTEAEFPHRSVAAEIGAAFRVSDRTVQRMLGEAVALVISFPATHAALEAGDISPAHARVIIDAATPLTTDPSRAAYEENVLPVAYREPATRVNDVARRLAEKFATEALAPRHERVRQTRRVWVSDLADGMSQLSAILPSVLAHGIEHRLTVMAHDVKDAARAGAADNDVGVEVDERRIPQLTADIFADLLLSTDPTAHANRPTGLDAVRAEVQVIISADTLNGTSPGFLNGAVPIDADSARALAGDAPAWEIVTRHPLTHDVLTVDRYRPSEAQRRLLRARDQRCRFPGCRMPVRRCDLDHTIDHALGGETACDNLAHLCRRHHMLKHNSAWTVRQQPGGILEWASPTGRVYPDHPPGAIVFTPDPDPALAALAPF